MLQAALWPQKSTGVRQGQTLLGQHNAQLIVIGAGYSGASAALHLAEAGYDVAVIEADQPGAGASGRNAAGWLPTYFDKSPDDVVDMLGPVQGGALNQMIAESARLVPALVAKHDMAVDIRQSGIAMLSPSPQMAPEFQKRAQRWNDFGGNIDFLGPNEVRGIVGSDRVSHALLYRDAGTLNPFAYAAGLADAAVKAGARLYTGTPACRIVASAQGWTVETATGSVTAPQVLIATEGYHANRSLWPGLERTYYALPFALVASDPVPELAAQMMPRGMPLTDSNKGNPFWIMADPEGRLVASLLPPRRTSASADQVARPLVKKLHQLFGELPPLRWSHFWTGNVALSAERIPRLLSLADGVHAIGGYSGQGIGAATAAGQEYAKLIVAGDPSACRLPILKPRTLPLRGAVPALFRYVVAPLGRVTDRSYRAVNG